MGAHWTRARTTVGTALNQGSVDAHSRGARARQGVRLRLRARALALARAAVAVGGGSGCAGRW